MAYENLRDKQAQWQKELTYLVEQGERMILAPPEQCKKQKERIESIKTKFEETHQLLVELKNQHPELAQRGYFEQKAYKVFDTAHKKAIARLTTLEEEYKLHQDRGPNSNELLALLLQLQKEIGEVRGKAQSTGNEAVQQMLEEFRYQRNSLKFPKFPVKDVVINYRDWRCCVSNHERTNPATGSIRMQFLKESARGSPAEPIVSLFNIDDDSFANAITALDNRFYIVRAMVGEFVEIVLQLSSRQSKSSSEHLKNVLDGFNGLQKNVEGMCREYINSLTPMMGREASLESVMLDALLSALFLRTVDDNTKTYLTSKLNLKSSSIPDFKELIATLEKRLNAIMGSHDKGHAPKVHAAVVTNTMVRIKNHKCALCKGPHRGFACPKITSLSTIAERYTLLKKLGICFICLDRSNENCSCRDAGRACRLCGSAHNMILCELSMQKNQSQTKGAPRENRRFNGKRKSFKQGRQQKKQVTNNSFVTAVATNDA